MVVEVNLEKTTYVYSQSVNICESGTLPLLNPLSVHPIILLKSLLCILQKKKLMGS